MKAGGMKGGRGGKRKGPARIGEIRVWGDGEKMRKGAGGKWEAVKEGAKKQVKAAAASIQNYKDKRAGIGVRAAPGSKRKIEATNKAFTEKQIALGMLNPKPYSVKVGQIRKKGEPFKQLAAGSPSSKKAAAPKPKMDKATQKKPPLDAKGQPPAAIKKALAKEQQFQREMADVALSYRKDKLTRAEKKEWDAKSSQIQKKLEEHRKSSGLNEWRESMQLPAGKIKIKASRAKSQTGIDPKINKALDKERQLQSKLYDVSRKVDGAKGAAAKAARAEEKAVQKELAQHRKDSGLDAWRSFSNPTVKDVSQRTARQREQTKSRTSKK
jgi:hypothetical protein